MTSLDFATLFDAARRVDIVAVAGTPLFRAGRRLRGECPLCGASKGKRSDGAFSVEPAEGVFKCFACGRGGDVITLEQELRGGSPREAAARLVDRAPRRPRPSAPARAPGASNEGLARRLWSEARPAVGSLVETYLSERGLVAASAIRRGALDRLRFHPEAPWGVHNGRRVTRPAMVTRVLTHLGATGGVHLTYLTPDGTRKTGLRPAKRMFGPQARDGRPGGVILSDIVGRDRAIVAEGIETALSAAALIDPGCAIMASLSLDRLQGGWLPDKYGRYDPDQPAADLSRPAFAWPRPDSPWSEVAICVDRDMSPIRVKARRAAGGSYFRELGSDARARVCGSLAVQHWRHAQPGLRVSVCAAAVGRDFNDELRARLGA